MSSGQVIQFLVAEMRQGSVKKAKFYQNEPCDVSFGNHQRPTDTVFRSLINTSHVAAIAVMAVALHSQTASAADICSVASGPQRVATIELYTSEGCDSCPPADKWLRELPAKKLGTDRLIPLAFHVDYWNQLGWTDPFAQARFSDRQRQHSKRRGASFVFTPQLLLNGQDYRRGMLFDDIASKVKNINSSRPLADIRLAVSKSARSLHGSVEVDARNPQQRDAQLFLALYENGLVSEVKAGENKGHTLKHDFVVRELAGPFNMDNIGRVRHAQTFRLAPDWKVRDLKLAAFVQAPQNGDIWQAVSGCP